MLLWAILATASAETFPAAPSLGVSNWLHGDPVDIPDEGVVVVELWATWCGPCIDQLPHLDALSEEYAGKVEVVAVSDERAGTVSGFWRRQGWAPDFSVGVDPSGRTTGRYQRIDGATGIPRAYIVHDGRVAWSGHPARIDGPLAAVVADNWGPEQAAFMADIRGHYERYFYAAGAGNQKKAAAIGEQIVQHTRQMPSLLNELAWNILTVVPDEHRDRPLALRAAQDAVAAAPGDAAYLDTLGLALYQNGQVEQAVDVQQRAVAACDAQGAAFCDELRQRLGTFTAP